MTQTGETTSAVLKEIERLSEIAEKATHGPWEWSECFDPEGDTCGLIEVRIPSDRAWDQPHGYYYLRIADMEWAEGEDLWTAQLIAESRTALPRLLTALRASIETLNFYAGNVRHVPGAIEHDAGGRARDALATSAQALTEGGEGE